MEESEDLEIWTADDATEYEATDGADGVRVTVPGSAGGSRRTLGAADGKLALLAELKRRGSEIFDLVAVAGSEPMKIYRVTTHHKAAQGAILRYCGRDRQRARGQYHRHITGDTQLEVISDANTDNFADDKVEQQAKA